jgi:membrane protein
MNWLQSSWQVLREAASDWMEDNAARMGAALAFYSVLSLAPLLLIAIGLAGMFFDEADARSRLVAQMSELVGKEGSEAIQTMLENGSKTGGAVSTIVGLVTLLFGASGVFGELQSAMDAVWDVKPKNTGFWGFLRARFLSFAMVLGTGFLLVVSLLASTMIAALQNSVQVQWPALEPALHTLSLAVTFAIVTLLFALIYKLLPDAKVTWSEAWIGAIVTAALFSIGKLAIGLYLGKSGLASGYGAAGSLVVLIVWIYYSAQIVFFGAEITHAIGARRTGDAPQPAENAVPAHLSPNS